MKIIYFLILISASVTLVSCKQAPPTGCENPGNECPDGTVYLVSNKGKNIFTTFNGIQKSYEFFSEKDQTSFTRQYLAAETCNEIDQKDSCIAGKNNTDFLIQLSNVQENKVHEAALACYCLGEQHINAPDTSIPEICQSDPARTNTIDGHGYDDWYLPSIIELNLIYSEIKKIPESKIAGSFSNNHYWSSSVISNLRAWKIFFGDGTASSYNNKNNIHVRCLRQN